MGALPPRVGIAGLGLVGGSIARGIGLRVPGTEVRGWDPDPAAGAAAGAAHVVAGLAADIGALARSVDLLVLAGPVDGILSDLDALGACGAGVVVTDVGSTKVGISARALAVLPADVLFAGGHPIAGSERGGFRASRADLFEGAPWALVPPGEAGHPAPVPDEILALVGLLGARPVIVDAAAHDEILARTSHLPQTLAVALANVVADLLEAHPLARELVGSGLTDLLRIAESPQRLWSPILAGNAAQIRSAVAELGAHLDAAQDPERSAAAFARAARLRRHLPRRGGS